MQCVRLDPPQPRDRDGTAETHERTQQCQTDTRRDILLQPRRDEVEGEAHDQECSRQKQLPSPSVAVGIAVFPHPIYQWSPGCPLRRHPERQTRESSQGVSTLRNV